MNGISIKFDRQKLVPVDNIKYVGMYLTCIYVFNLERMLISHTYVKSSAEVMLFYLNLDTMCQLKPVYKYTMPYFILILLMDVTSGDLQQKKI